MFILKLSRTSVLLVLSLQLGLAQLNNYRLKPVDSFTTESRGCG